MAFFDLPLEQLKTYMPEVREPQDFDVFWVQTLNEARQHPLDAVFEPIDSGLALVDTYDVTFSGYGGQRIKGWLILPKVRDDFLPCVVQYIGYTGGRGLVFDRLFWSAAGYAHFIMDTRGQGGDTPDLPDGGSPSVPGWMTQGILNPQVYYYRRVFTDAVRAVEAARSHDSIDRSQVAVLGGSQGGGISIAVSGLVDDLVASLPDVPFLCYYERAATMVDSHPYQEIPRFLRTHREQTETVYQTLSYFDGVNFAKRTSAPTLYSVALMDQICPPSTVFAAFNRVTVEKQIKVYPYNGHEGGGNYQRREQLRFLQTRFGS